MRTTSFAKVAALCGLLALSGCASKITQPDKYSGFLNNYSDLKETTSATGKPVLRWVDPSFDQSKYDSIVWNPITYYPVPKPSTQVGLKVLDRILSYTNTEMKEAIAQRNPLVTTAGPRSLIFRGAITGVDTSKEGLQFYEVVPVALVVAGTQMATGHRTMDTRLYFEGELIDAATNKPVIKVVRQGEGKDLNNESTPMAFENIKQVIDDMATDATMFDVNKKYCQPRHRKMALLIIGFCQQLNSTPRNRRRRQLIPKTPNQSQPMSARSLLPERPPQQRRAHAHYVAPDTNYRQWCLTAPDQPASGSS